MEEVTRIEVIDGKGRSYSNLKVKSYYFDYQDNGKTLKIFIQEKDQGNTKNLLEKMSDDLHNEKLRALIEADTYD